MNKLTIYNNPILDIFFSFKSNLIKVTISLSFSINIITPFFQSTSKITYFEKKITGPPGKKNSELEIVNVLNENLSNLLFSLFSD